jgi:hypothetical protein
MNRMILSRGGGVVHYYAAKSMPSGLSIWGGVVRGTSRLRTMSRQAIAVVDRAENKGGEYIVLILVIVSHWNAATPQESAAKEIAPIALE